ncbi:two-component system, NarL family, sensor histidine kinase DesK [Streptosporangium subroseum]|uniref:Two-component system, NarL family, sensor histidine kinase DesK n=1 Tax=Streptosporangium subroseum TaxID=106412 RepID=A0A239MS44_9ACTN|nr:two-component system, NarL family, sensor histidine kinase DesK [Streptosporangium subroseum]
MAINDDEGATGRLRRSVLRFFPRGGKRTPVERLRRLTFWSLIIGIPLAWAGAFNGIAAGGKADSEALPTLVLGLLGLIAFSAVYMRMVKAAVAGTTANREIVVSGVLVIVLLLTQETHLWTWGLLAPAWATGAALLLNRVGTLVASLGATVVPLFLVSIGDGLFPGFDRMMVAPYEADEQGLIGTFVGVALVMPSTNRLQLWFWQVVKLAEEGKEAQARLAVTEERLRFSRDLHDLVGHSLSAIAVKSEVAVKLSSVDAARAVAEMDEVRGLARQALKEIRTAVRGYRVVDLDAELRSMTAVLEAAGIRCTLETPREQVPDELATLLAWVVREGATNVLRHSSATRCRIAVALRDGTAVLEMTNDGVAGTGGRGGTGLAGLSERLATVGGAVTVGGDGKGDGEFRLRATIPLEGMR